MSLNQTQNKPGYNQLCCWGRNLVVFKGCCVHIVVVSSFIITRLTTFMLVWIFFVQKNSDELGCFSRTCSRMPHFTWVLPRDGLLLRHGREREGRVWTIFAPATNSNPGTTEQIEAREQSTEIQTSRLIRITPDLDCQLSHPPLQIHMCFGSFDCNDCGLFITSTQRQTVGRTQLSLCSQFSRLMCLSLRRWSNCWLNSEIWQGAPCCLTFFCQSQTFQWLLHDNTKKTCERYKPVWWFKRRN